MSVYILVAIGERYGAKKIKDSKGLAVFDLWSKLWHLSKVKKIQHYFENPYFAISIKKI